MGRAGHVLSGVAIGLVIALVLGQFGGAHWLAGRPAGHGPLVDGDMDDVAHGAAEDGDDERPPARLAVIDGRRRLVLSAADLQLADVAIETLVAGEFVLERRVPGIVIDAAALREAQRARAAAEAARRAQMASAAALEERLQRLTRIAADTQLGAQRELAELELGWRRELERGVALDAELGRLEQLLTAQWGTALVAASRPGTALDRALAGGESALIQFAAPAAAPPHEVFIAVDGKRDSARVGTLVGAAPDVMPGVPGATWYVDAPAAGLRRGMRVDVWLAQGANTLRGVRLPASALVWHAGQRWYFAALGEGVFERRALPADVVVQGRAVMLPATGGTALSVVTRGAQTLLSEEFRGAIPDEDED